MNFYQNILSITLFICGLTDFLRVFRLGGITALGILTLILAPTTWVLVFIRSKMPKVVLVASWLVLFVIFALIDWLWHYSTLSLVTTIQNLSLYIAFVGFVVLSTIQSNRTFDLPKYISQSFPTAIKISVGLYGLSLIINGPGASLIMGPRSFALFAIIGIAWCLAAWRYRLPGGLLWASFTIMAIALSFSRTALLIALILFPLSQISLKSLKGWVRMGLTVALIATVAYLAFTYVEPIRSRFTAVGDNATVGGVQINTSGRNVAWPVAYASAMESPWIGKGPSSVGIVLGERVGPAFIHPHNDYLRIFHDYGLIGLTFWFLGYSQLIIKTWQNWQWADQYDRANAHVHLAAFLALVAVSLSMISDNVIVYIFSMAPLGILVGASLGSGSRRKKMIKSTSKLSLVSDSLEQVAVKP
ncbi:MAG: O-antigen ligase family protein [Komarekiella atlantica HA4396-MV6]|jgi:O-antigen ligase|nr:O-antigen ligase family protein [Komarekiella atlantica HA4396-MV6]